MTNDLFIKIVGAIITIIISLVSAYVVPAIKASISEKDMNTLLNVIKAIVRAADQIYTPDEWQKKKEHVLAAVIGFVDRNLHIKLTEADINDLIEGIVNDLHGNGVRDREDK